MTIRSLACGTLVACVTAAASPAAGGVWSYGCKGNLGNDQIIFDRESLVVLPRKLPAGDIRALVKREIATFDAADNNSGLQQTMEFRRGAYPDQRVTLTETSSRKTSERTGHLGKREEITTTFRKTLSVPPLRRSGGEPAARHRDELRRLPAHGALMITAASQPALSLSVRIERWPSAGSWSQP